MTPEEEKTVRGWGETLPETVRLVLARTADDRTRQFEDFCRRLSDIAPKIFVEKDADDESPFPSLRTGRVVYRAVPRGRELAPFLAFLQPAKDSAPTLSDTALAYLESLELPATLKIYMSSTCPHCPRTVRTFLDLSAHSEQIRVVVIDGELFPELAAADQIRSVPTVILDDGFRWTGHAAPEEVLKIASDRDPAKLGADSLRNMIEAGQAEQVADLMIENGGVFPAFPQLLIHRKWPVRLGAMVVVEYITEKNRQLAVPIVSELWARFEGLDDQVKGDVLYFIGKTGAPEARPILEKVLDGSESPEVMEAAREALEALEKA